MSEAEILKKLADAVVACEPETARAAAEEALKEGVDPVLAINEGLVVGMGVIGDNYANHTMYLPQVLVAAHSMYEGLDVLRPYPRGTLRTARQRSPPWSRGMSTTSARTSSRRC